MNVFVVQINIPSIWRQLSSVLLVIFFSGCLIGCQGKKEAKERNIEEIHEEELPAVDMSNKGIGPIKALELGEINLKMVEEGKKLFSRKCISCHDLDREVVAPALRGVTKRRSPEWIMNMILNPEEMMRKDPIAKAERDKYTSLMTNLGLSQTQSRALLEYFRAMDE
ncbi:c-type cytochrome [Xanthovirga aplysinae]|uniref:c-type cytochrome n=1 Tax=Xanthovirga aplysinae TaxID=2529853 RepID=UPI0012BB5891|nr:cytochrome c [Xanthovirga aplysinae]MTI32823.1 cytochrome c [Xanthovirga aplysinae]